jgi:hypothetical protein
MAKVKLNPVMEQMRGKIGDLVFKRYEDRVIVSRKPDIEGQVSTVDQENNRTRFRLAAAYGKEAFADPAKKALYEATAKTRGKPAFALAVGDFMIPPVIDEIDLGGYSGQPVQTITVRASDDFGVAGVVVAVKDGNGTVIEQGAAVFELGVWRYVTTAVLSAARPATIEAIATDRPGNQTSRVKTLA